MTPRLARGALAIAAVAGAAGVASPACHRAPAAPIAALHDGLAIALYTRAGGGYGVVDDRRWIELAGDAVVLDRVNPGAALPSLVIEPLAGGALEVGACRRDRIAIPEPAPGRPVADASADARADASPDPRDATPASDALSPVLRCAARGRPGRYLVRLLYVSGLLGYRAQHDIAATAPGRATVVSRFAIVTPAWRTRADVALFDGGVGSAPREIARGAIELDGSTAVLATPPREVTARLRRVYDGGVRRPEGPDAGRSAVGPRVAPRRVGLARARRSRRPPRARPGARPRRARRRAGPRHRRPGRGPPAPRRRAAAAAVDRRGAARQAQPLDRAPGDRVRSDRFLLSIANLGDTPREVWVEEPLRPARPTITRAWPRAPELGPHRLRLPLTVAPGATERAGFAIEYER